MRAKVSWVKGLRFVGTSGSNHAVVMESKKEGEEQAAPSPMEMVLLALGGCASIDIADILRKKRQDFTGLEVEIEGERAPEPPRVFTTVTLEFVISGPGVTDEAVRHAVKLSMDKYCSVASTLQKAGAKTIWKWRNEAGGKGEMVFDPAKAPAK